MRVLSPITARPRTPPGVGKRQGGLLASCARGRRHTGLIVFLDRRCSFTRARLRLSRPPLKKDEQKRDCLDRCGRLGKAHVSACAGLGG